MPTAIYILEKYKIQLLSLASVLADAFVVPRGRENIQVKPTWRLRQRSVFRRKKDAKSDDVNTETETEHDENSPTTVTNIDTVYNEFALGCGW